MKTTVRRFNPEGFLIKVLCWSVVILLVIVAYRGQAVDEWTSRMENQVKILAMVTLIAAYFTGKWFIKRIQE